MRHRTQALGVGDDRGTLDRGQPRVQQKRGHAQLEEREQRDDAPERVAGDDGVRAAGAHGAAQHRQLGLDERRELRERVPAAGAGQRGRVRRVGRGGADRQRVAHPRDSPGGAVRERYGSRRNLRKSGGRFSRYAFLPSRPSSDR